MKNFKEKVLNVVRTIPEGETCTYKQVAERAGRPLAARTVGNIMARNWDHTVPCHRVIRSDGKLGGYNRGQEEKMRRLQSEGASRLESGPFVDNLFNLR